MVESNILYFPRRRGRPKKHTITDHDKGTPELQAKRVHQLTIEPLDYCLHEQLINDEQHWCGIHLRWLYTLRYGAPSLQALNPAHIRGITNNSDDPDWRTAREQEYTRAINLLGEKGYAQIIVNLCIHHERPDFLKKENQHSKKCKEYIDKLRNGLDVLVTDWRKIPNKSK
jgi:hypothetical protein